MRSVELTLDPEADAAIRADWETLARAGLPSLAQHAGASNAPHVTVAAGTAFDDTPELRAAFSAIPLTLRFGGAVVFAAGRRGFVLARLIVASASLLALHRAVHDTIVDAVELTLPDHWTPHVTLARRISADELARALPILGAIESAQFTAARLWDSETKTLTELT